MLDGVSLDQLRTFIAAADEGSFSAAGRRLRRAQSVVSETLANLEGQLSVKLFDRSAAVEADLASGALVQISVEEELHGNRQTSPIAQPFARVEGAESLTV
jgi:hypothetical protein